MDIKRILNDICIDYNDRNIKNDELENVDSLMIMIKKILHHDTNYDDYYRIYWKNENIGIISKMNKDLDLISSLNDFDMFLQKYFFHLSFIFIYSRNNFPIHIFLSNIKKWIKYLETINLNSLLDDDILKFLKFMDKINKNSTKIDEKDYCDICILYLQYKFDDGDTSELFDLSIKYNLTSLFELIRNDTREKINKILLSNNIDNINIVNLRKNNIDNFNSKKLMRLLNKKLNI